MKAARALCLLACIIGSPGCALVEDGTRNFCVAVCTPVEVHREKARNKRWAEEAWLQYCVQNPAKPPSPDFEEGFRAGYAEYLFRGGDGEPPIVAPLHYRQVRYQTPDGYHAVQEWFDGYRVGSGVARDSGARRWVTIASSLHARQALPGPEFTGPEPSEISSAPRPKFSMPMSMHPPVPLFPQLFPSNQIEPVRTPRSINIGDPEPVQPRIIGVRTAPAESEPEAPTEPPRLRIEGVRTSPPVEP